MAAAGRAGPGEEGVLMVAPALALAFPTSWPVVALLLAGAAVAAGGAYLARRRRRGRPGRAGGWNELADRFPAPGPPHEGRDVIFHGEAVRLAAGHASDRVTVGVGPDGLYLKAPWHPAALIPWGQVRGAHEVAVKDRDAYRLTVGDPKVTEITVSPIIYDASWTQIQSLARHGPIDAVLDLEEGAGGPGRGGAP
jgi:hypothetical protein